MRFFRVLRTLLIKDWLAEFRGGQILPLCVVLAVSVIMLFRLAGLEFAGSSTAWAAILWIITLLDLVIILDRVLACELGNGVLEAMLSGPISAAEFMVSKMIFSGLILIIIQAFVLVLLRFMMELSIDTPIFMIVFSVGLADLGLILIGLMCSMIALMTKHRAALLAGMLWPMSLPIVVLAMLMARGGSGDNYWLILAGFDLVLLGFWPGLLKLIVSKK